MDSNISLTYKRRRKRAQTTPKPGGKGHVVSRSIPSTQGERRFPIRNSGIKESQIIDIPGRFTKSVREYFIR